MRLLDPNTRPSILQEHVANGDDGLFSYAPTRELGTDARAVDGVLGDTEGWDPTESRVILLLSK